MAANVQPIYSRIADIQFSAIVTASATAGTAGAGTGGSYDGTSPNAAVIFTADSSAGGFIQRIRCKANGAVQANVARIFINNGGASSSAANNAMIAELSLPLLSSTSVAAQPDLDVQLGFGLPPSYVLLVTLGVQATGGWTFVGIGGKY